MPIRVLIADDNASVRAAMRQVLEAAEEHWEIIEAENGKVAVAQAEQLKPNLVVLDLVMPVMDGLVASREIAKLLPQVPILMHTLHSTPGLELEAGKFGIRKVVSKSDSIALVSAVQDVLDSQLPASSPADAETESPEMVTAMRRTEDKIRELCTRLFETNKDETHTPVFGELQEALHEHIEHLRTRVAQYPVVVERRLQNRISPLDMPAHDRTTNESRAAEKSSLASASMAAPAEEV